MKRSLLLAVLASVGCLTQLSASVINTLTENACSGGGVTVTATTIDWSPDGTEPDTGCIDSGAATDLAWSGGGSLGPGVAGNIMDLTAGGGSVDSFITFPSVGLDFTLTTLGPGSSNVGMAACAAATANGDSCSVFAGSPFILTYDNGNTDVSLAAGGTVYDPNAPSQVSDWSGGFSVTVADQTPSQVYSDFESAGMITTGQQGQFVVSASAVPEPGTISMALIGMAFLTISAKRRRA